MMVKSVQLIHRSVLQSTMLVNIKRMIQCLRTHETRRKGSLLHW